MMVMGWLVAGIGLVLIVVLGAFQLVALRRPYSRWTIENVYGGEPTRTDPAAYFAFNQGFAWADALFWVPLQVVASVGIFLDEQWGLVFGLMASVPFWYSAVPLFVWDRALHFRRNHWVVTWGVWPLFGVIEGAYCTIRLLA